MEYVLLASLLLYWILVAILHYGLAKTRDNVSNAAQHFVSVIIAARNEERNLPACLSSLAQQTYPAGLFEVIVVDDHSTDGTKTVCTTFRRHFAHFRVVEAAPDKQLTGKTNALASGIDHAKGEVILVTDADCTVPRTWIEATVRRYSQGVGLVGGMTMQKSDGPFSGMQSLDWAFLLGIAAAGVNLRNPLSTIGNNLSFRRAAYDDTGGYRAIKFSVTEDFALFQAIVRTRKWEYFYPLDPDHLVESKPCPDWRDLLRQKHRWGKGGLDMKLSGLVVMAVGFLMHSALIAGLCVGDLALTGSVLFAKALADYTFLDAVLCRIGRRDERRYFYWFELYYIVYVLVLPFLVFFGGKVRWKGRDY